MPNVSAKKTKQNQPCYHKLCTYELFEHAFSCFLLVGILIPFVGASNICLNRKNIWTGSLAFVVKIWLILQVSCHQQQARISKMIHSVKWVMNSCSNLLRIQSKVLPKYIKYLCWQTLTKLLAFCFATKLHWHFLYWPSSLHISTYLVFMYQYGSGIYWIQTVIFCS